MAGGGGARGSGRDASAAGDRRGGPPGSRPREARQVEALERLAGGIAHDFNNLICVILGHASRIEARLTDPAMRYSLRQIVEAAKRAGALTEQLLAFGRVEELEPMVFDPAPSIRRVAAALRRRLGPEVALEVRLEDPLGPVRADPARLEQVLMSLAVNALEAMPSGGRLTLEAHHVHVRPEDVRERPDARPGEHVHVLVRDTGTGMDEATLARAFEPFFTTKTERQSTGLGLAAAHGFVKQSGGDIILESRPGEGTVAHVYLPAVQTKREPPRPGR
jgi:signal transduction histidine kinase